jgi:hypothetical protein
MIIRDGHVHGAPLVCMSMQKKTGGSGMVQMSSHKENPHIPNSRRPVLWQSDDYDCGAIGSSLSRSLLPAPNLSNVFRRNCSRERLN